MDGGALEPTWRGVSRGGAEVVGFDSMPSARALAASRCSKGRMSADPRAARYDDRVALVPQEHAEIDASLRRGRLRA